MKKLFILIACMLMVSACSVEKKGEAVSCADDNTLAKVQSEIDKFAKVELPFDESLINDNQREVLKKLVEAAKVMDEIFLRQVYSKNVDIRKHLMAEQCEMGKKNLELFNIHKGPFNRLEGDKPFIGTAEKPHGANFYPEDMTKEEFASHLKAFPADRDAFESNFTVIRRDAEGTLKAVPYSVEYKELLEKAAGYLKEAAAMSQNESVKNYLEKRATAFLSNDYYDSDMAWMDMKDHAVEVVIGPYEVYEDALFGYKAAFESFVTVRDPEKSQKLAKIADYLLDFEKNLPIPEAYKNFNRGLESPTVVAQEVFTGGDTKAAVQTIAFNLPNDERVREAKGSKKVMLENISRAKYDKILTPIGKVAIEEGSLSSLSFEAFFMHTYLHEISHGLGPGSIEKDGVKTTVNKELKELYSLLEEAKADTLGVYNGMYLCDRGEFEEGFKQQLITTFITSIFRSVRFGIDEAHGGGNIMIFNYLSDMGVINFNESTEKFSIVLDKAPGAFKQLASELLTMQALGDYQKAAKFIETYKVERPSMALIRGKMNKIPVDIKPIYPQL